MSLLVIISGPPGAGKTTLGRRLARELRLPLLSRDDLKETLFDSLGWEDRGWPRRLGAASYALLYRVVEALLEAGQSLVLESNFNPEFDAARFLELKARHGFELLQVRCTADPEVRFERFKRRAESGERHPGHVDHLNLDEFRTALSEEWPLLEIGGRTVEVDTTDPSAVNYEDVVETIAALRG